MSDIRYDFRSDTVTRPTKAMRDAMNAASVGDDVYGEDPTVNRLEREAAELLDKEAGLFCTSGTQSNLIALMIHCGRGDEFIAGQMAHLYRWEGGGASVLGSIQPQPIPNQLDGSLALQDIADAIKPLDPHFAVTRLLALENTFGGQVLPQAYVDAASTLARRHGLSLHLDGARLFNAAIASAVPASRLARDFDTVSICLSKGLGAPVGSVLVGSRNMIEKGRRLRKLLGGGMRQAGIIAAAGIHALHHHIDRLAEDHENASQLAAGLARLPGVSPTIPHSNIVFVDLEGFDATQAKTAFLASGIGVGTATGNRLRLVTHLDVGKEGVEAALITAEAIFRSSTKLSVRGDPGAAVAKLQ